MDTLYLYASHLGGFYLLSDELTLEERYCECCGDSDVLVGIVHNFKEAWELLMDEEIYGREYVNLQVVFPMLTKTFKIPIEFTYNSFADEVDGACDLTDEEILTLADTVIERLNKTNYERITSMSLEELASILTKKEPCSTCAFYNGLVNECGDCLTGVIEWLNQPAAM